MVKNKTNINLSSIILDNIIDNHTIDNKSYLEYSSSSNSNTDKNKEYITDNNALNNMFPISLKHNKNKIYYDTDFYSLSSLLKDKSLTNEELGIIMYEIGKVYHSLHNLGFYDINPNIMIDPKNFIIKILDTPNTKFSKKFIWSRDMKNLGKYFEKYIGSNFKNKKELLDLLNTKNNNNSITGSQLQRYIRYNFSTMDLIDAKEKLSKYNTKKLELMQEYIINYIK